MPVGASGAAKPLIQTTYSEFNADLSPNGRWIAYTSNESGQQQVYVRPFPDVDNGRWQISTSGGDQAAWSCTGRDLYFIDARGMLMSAPVRTDEASFSGGTPTQVLRERVDRISASSGSLGGRTCDVSPDGRRFLIITDAARAEGKHRAVELMVILNFDEELKRLVPAR